jgi:hypothetical protein
MLYRAQSIRTLKPRSNLTTGMALALCSGIVPIASILQGHIIGGCYPEVMLRTPEDLHEQAEPACFVTALYRPPPPCSFQCPRSSVIGGEVNRGFARCQAMSHPLIARFVKWISLNQRV